MAQYQITTTPIQETALSAVVAEANAVIDAQNASSAAQKPARALLPHMTNETYLLQRVSDVLTSYAQTHRDALAKAALDGFASASTTNQEQILSLLGMSLYGSLPSPALQQVLSTIGLQSFIALDEATQNQIFTLAGIAAFPPPS